MSPLKAAKVMAKRFSSEAALNREPRGVAQIEHDRVVTRRAGVNVLSVAYTIFVLVVGHRPTNHQPKLPIRVHFAEFNFR